MNTDDVQAGEILISDDRARLDRAWIHTFLAQSCWAAGIPRAVVDRSLDHSLCFGAYRQGAQVGFARVITDFATFAWLADVFVLEAERRAGVGKQLIGAIQHHPRLQGLRDFMLATADAHGLYARFGFKPVSHPERFMSIQRPDIYKTSASADPFAAAVRDLKS